MLDAGIRHDSSEVTSLAAVFGGLTVMLMVTIVVAVFTVSLNLRRPEISLARALGLAPGQLRRLIAGEVLALGTLSVTIGLVLTTPLTSALLDVVVQAGIAPPGTEAPPRWIPMAVTAATSILVSLAAGLGAVHRLARLSPADALSERHDRLGRISPTHVGIATFILTGALSLSLVTLLVMRGPVVSATAAPALFLWTGGAALLAPLVVRPLVLALGVLIRPVGLPARLAVHGVRHRIGAIAPVAVSVMLAFGTALGLVLMQLAIDQHTTGGASPNVGGVVNYLLVGLIVALATVSFVNSIALWVSDCWMDAKTIRALGASPLLAGAALIIELALGVVAGMVLGLVIAAITVLSLLAGLRPDGVLPEGTWSVLMGVTGAALGVATVAGVPLVALLVRRPVSEGA